MLSFIGVFSIPMGVYTNIIVKTLKYLFLFLYYRISVDKMNKYILGFIFLDYISGLLYIRGYLETSTITSLILCRVLIFSYLLKINTFKGVKIKRFIELIVVLLFILFLLAMLIFNNSLFYKNNISYLVAGISAEITLIITLFFAFLNLQETIQKGNLLILIAISLYIISDSLFTTLQFEQLKPFVIKLIASIYVIADFMIVQSNVIRTNTKN